MQIAHREEIKVREKELAFAPLVAGCAFVYAIFPLCIGGFVCVVLYGHMCLNCDNSDE
jgi:hypothetical protein